MKRRQMIVAQGEESQHRRETIHGRAQPGRRRGANFRERILDADQIR
jgi:hypothetical protein